MLKLAGAVLLIAAGFLAGFLESYKLAVRVERLEAFLRFLSAAKTEVRYSAMPVARLVRRHGGELPFLGLCADRCEAGADWAQAWASAVSEEAEQEGFSEKDAAMLLDFGAGFGASDTQGQLAHFDLYAGLAAAALKEAREERDRKSKLYRMLGISGGMAAAILLC